MAQNFDLQQTGQEVQERVNQVPVNTEDIAAEVQARIDGDAAVTQECKGYTDAENERAVEVENSLQQQINEIVTGDIDGCRLEGKTFVVSQEDFDAIIEDAVNGVAVDAVLAPGTFVVKKCINNLNSPFNLVGSEGTILKRNNRIYRRTDAVTAHNTATHIAYNLEDEPIEPFSIFVNGDNDIINVSEYAHVIYTTHQYLDGNGDPITNATYSDESKYPDGLFFVPAVDISIPVEQLPFVYGYTDGAWSADRFRLTGNIRTIDNVLYFEAKLLPRNNTTNILRFISNPNFQLNQSVYRINTFVLYNTGTDEGLYYNEEYLFVPNSEDSVEIIDGWFYHHPYVETDYNGRPQFIIKNRTANAPITLQGILFRNFQNLLDIREVNATSEQNYIGFTITDCVFEKCTAYVLYTMLTAPYGHYTDKETSYINGCRFEGCGLTGYFTILSRAETTGWTSHDKNCINTGKDWIVLKDCVFDGSIDGVSPYKNTQGLVGLYIDCHVLDCVFINTARDHLTVDEGNVIIERCDFFDTDKFNADRIRNIGADSGLIYLSGASNHMKSPVLIKDCHFHDYISTDSRRLVYLDEGRTNVTVQGNVIHSTESICVDARTTDNGNMTFYAFVSGSDIIYTLSNKIYDSNVYTYDGNTFTDTGIKIAITSFTPISSVVYDGRTWEYDESKNISGINWSSANVRYIDNVISGYIRLVYGDGVQEDMMPVIQGNVFCGEYADVIGSYAMTHNNTPYIDDLVYLDNTNIPEGRFVVDNGVLIDSTIFTSLPVEIKQKTQRMILPVVDDDGKLFPIKSLYSDFGNISTYGYFHHIQLTWNNNGIVANSPLVKSFLKIKFVCNTTLPHSYELVVTRSMRICSFVCNGLSYDFGKVFIWRSPDDTGSLEHWHIAISVESFSGIYGIAGGFFEFEGEEDVLDTITVNAHEPFSNLPANFSRLEEEGYIYVPDGRHIGAIIDNRHNLYNNVSEIIFSEDYSQHPFSLRRLASHFYMGPCEIVHHGRNGDGYITRYGIYVAKGTTDQRPTPKAGDSGLVYYDTDLKKLLVWDTNRWLDAVGNPIE